MVTIFLSRRDFFSRSLAAFLAAISLLSLNACHHSVTDPNDRQFIVAETPNWNIKRGELDDEVNTFLKQSHKTAADIGPAKMPQLQTAMLRNMVLKKLLLARAATLPLKDVDKEEAALLAQLQQHFPSDAELQAQMKLEGVTMDELKRRIHEDVLIRKTLELEALQNVTPTDAEINAFYLQNKDKFAIAPKVRASRIVILVDQTTTPAQKVAKKKAIDAAHARVAKGEDFSKVATQVSEDRYSAPKGGDIGFFQKGENEPAFDDVAFATKPGIVSPVFETPMGYQFLKVTDVHPGGDVSIAEARDSITKYLLQSKQRSAEEAYTKKLLDEGNVTFHFVMIEPPAEPTSSEAAPQTSGSAPSTSPPSDSGSSPATNAAPQ